MMSGVAFHIVSLALVALLGLAADDPLDVQAKGASGSAVPTPDRLATPVMPESPTQVDIGRNLYYYHCMPCHGDRGQGLTDEWREVWDEDHRNCWGRGCHSGRAGEEGFPIPHFVPAVSGSPQAIAGFETENSLFEYLLQAHPPQRPGALVEEECWALTAFLLHENGRLAADDRIGSRTTEPFWLAVGVISGVVLVFLLLAFLVLWQKARLARRT